MIKIPLLYALATSLATLSGGALPLYTRLRHLEQRYLVAIAGGSMVAIALFDLLQKMQNHKWLALLVDGGFAPLGILVSNRIPASAIEPLLGFIAEVFLYVGASDLLPEAQRRFNRTVLLATLV